MTSLTPQARPTKSIVAALLALPAALLGRILIRKTALSLPWVVAALASVAVALPAMAAARPAKPEPRLSAEEAGGLYVALGDSVATFYPPTYVDRLVPYYQSTLGVTELSNQARTGATSGSLRTDGQLASALADINAASDTRVVTIDIGGVDALDGCDFTSASCPFRANFSATLVDLQAALANDPGAEPLIAMAYYNPDVGEPVEAMSDRQLLGASVTLNCADSGSELGLNDVIAQETDAHGALLANAYPAFKVGGQALMADSVHPNGAGHEAIAEAFRNASHPCAAPASPPPGGMPPPNGTPPQTPLNAFRLGKLKRNANKGTAKLRVRVPGPGELLLERTKRLRTDTDEVPGARKLWLRLRPRPKARHKLTDRGKLKVNAVVIYAPTGGESNTESKKVKLKRRDR